MSQVWTCSCRRCCSRARSCGGPRSGAQHGSSHAEGQAAGQLEVADLFGEALLPDQLNNFGRDGARRPNRDAPPPCVLAEPCI